MVTSNLSEIMGNISNINATFNFNTTDIVNTGIIQSNISTNGWIGIIILGMFTFAILIHLLKNRNQFYLTNEISLLLFTLNITIDLAFFLYQFRMLYNIQPVVFLFTAFVCVAIFSLLRKEINNYNN